MRTKTKTQPSKAAQNAPGNQRPFSEKNRVPLVLILLYIAVDLIPPGGATDVMGSQWLYLSILDLVCIGYFLWDKKTITSQNTLQVLNRGLTLVYVGLFILSGLSILTAINRIEALVCYARFSVALIAYVNLALLFNGRLQQFRFLSKVLSLLLLITSLQVLFAFFKGYGETELNDLILGLKGNAGNKNILAASLVIKIPFTFYSLYAANNRMRFFYAGILGLAVLAIAILNARAALISTLCISVLYIIFCLLSPATREKGQGVKNLIFTITPILIGFFFSQIILKNALALQNTSSGYGTVTNRLSTIGLTEEGSDYRLLQWKSALDYIHHHPFVGAGYGNWKLASIPYERSFSNELLVTYHVHNDFLEFAAETGLLGGVLLMGLFGLAAFYAYRILRSKQMELQPATVSVLLALFVYGIDALFNFPNERPVMQFFLVFLMALILNLYLQVSKERTVSSSPKASGIGRAFPAIAILLLIPSTWLIYSTYQSLVAQKTINSDVLSAAPVKTWEEVNQELPSIPNLNAFCFPIHAIKARYLLNEKRYAEALKDLDKSVAENPYLPYTEFLKAHSFLGLNRMDSAKYFADLAFDKRPRSLANLQLRNYVSYRLKDTATLGETFRIYTGFRKDQPEAWNNYLNYLYNLTHDTTRLLTLVDSALKLFPDDPGLQKKRADLSTAPQTAASLAAAPYLTKGLESFQKKDYDAAIQNFLRAGALDPGNYIFWENTALCYYVQNQWKLASAYFDKALRLNTARNGKSEFYKGVCLATMGDTTGACRFFHLSAAKNYPEAQNQISLICK